MLPPAAARADWQRCRRSFPRGIHPRFGMPDAGVPSCATGISVEVPRARAAGLKGRGADRSGYCNTRFTSLGLRTQFPARPSRFSPRPGVWFNGSRGGGPARSQGDCCSSRGTLSGRAASDGHLAQARSTLSCQMRMRYVADRPLRVTPDAHADSIDRGSPQQIVSSAGAGERRGLGLV